MPAASDKAPEDERRRETHLMPINHVVALNLARARRAAGWTQEETAQRLQEVSGQPWSAASLGAAERARAGRTREFNANELIAFCQAFGQPLAYFFLPPETGSFAVDVALTMRSKETNDVEQPTITEFDLLKWIVPLGRSPVVLERVQRILYKKAMSWDPASGRLEWLTQGEDYWEPPEQNLVSGGDSESEDVVESGRLSADEQRILESLGVTPERVAAEIAQHTREIADIVVAGLLRNAKRSGAKSKGSGSAWLQPGEPPL